ncbi:MAG: hypothetical protein ACKVUS_20725 [Saprospiraceae bacterium]
MGKALIRILLLLLLFVTALPAQSIRKRLKLLQNENDSLRLELQKCQTSPFLRLTESLESPKFGENPIYSREELQAKLLPQIKLKSEEKYAIALMVISSTDQFLQYCESIKTELLARRGSLDANGESSRIWDKKVPTVFFIEEKRGLALKSKVDAQRAEYLKVIQGNSYFTPRIILQTEALPTETTAKTWEEFKFKGMPLAAVFPMIGKYQSDAKGSEAAVLQYLHESR